MFSPILYWEPFVFSCLCVSSILTMVSGRPGRRPSRTPLPRRHEELFNQDAPADGPPTGIPPPITLFNTRVGHPARYFNQATALAAAPAAHLATTLGSHATAPADTSADSSESDQPPAPKTANADHTSRSGTHESRSTAVPADAKSSPAITSKIQTAAEFPSRTESLRSSSAPAPKHKRSGVKHLLFTIEDE